MKSFEIKALGLKELSLPERTTLNGGSVIGWIVGVMIGGIVYDLISNPSHNSEKVKEGASDAAKLW